MNCACFRRVAPGSAEDLLRRSQQELSSIRGQGNRALIAGLVVGAVAGVVSVLILLPDRSARIAELRARLGGLDAPTEYAEDIRRLSGRARESLAARIRRAKEEARQVQEDTRRELWARFEVAKRDGHQPPQD